MNEQARLDPEKSLIIRLMEGDINALSQLYRSHYPALLYYILKTAKSTTLAEDVLHDTFLKLWEYRANINPDEGLKPLLFTIAKRHLLNLLTRAGKETKIMSEIRKAAVESVDAVNETMAYREQRQLIDEAIAELPPRCRQVYEKCQIEGLSHQQVAEELGISVSTVNNQMVKANAHIQQFIKMQHGLTILIAAIMAKSIIL